MLRIFRPTLNWETCTWGKRRSISPIPWLPPMRQLDKGSMVVEMVPQKGGIGSIFHPPEGKDYKWYISGIFPANWGMDYATDPTF